MTVCDALVRFAAGLAILLAFGFGLIWFLEGRRQMRLHGFEARRTRRADTSPADSIE